VLGDGSGDHIPWANRLHEQLETYRVPEGDRTSATGEPMPACFFQTFRDEAEGCFLGAREQGLSTISLSTVKNNPRCGYSE